MCDYRRTPEGKDVNREIAKKGMSNYRETPKDKETNRETAKEEMFKLF